MTKIETKPVCVKSPRIFGRVSGRVYNLTDGFSSNTGYARFGNF
jgi:hypothetical protein